ncbi:MAG: hypothetical protein JWQ71_4995 [Pedosphaera sp.]|nr:hypothetical protein [Pedosphaera sp.]
MKVGPVFFIARPMERYASKWELIGLAVLSEPCVKWLRRGEDTMPYRSSYSSFEKNLFQRGE